MSYCLDISHPYLYDVSKKHILPQLSHQRRLVRSRVPTSAISISLLDPFDMTEMCTTYQDLSIGHGPAQTTQVMVENVMPPANFVTPRTPTMYSSHMVNSTMNVSSSPATAYYDRPSPGHVTMYDSSMCQSVSPSHIQQPLEYTSHHDMDYGYVHGMIPNSPASDDSHQSLQTLGTGVYPLPSAVPYPQQQQQQQQQQSHAVPMYQDAMIYGQGFNIPQPMMSNHTGMPMASETTQGNYRLGKRHRNPQNNANMLAANGDSPHQSKKPRINRDGDQAANGNTHSYPCVFLFAGCSEVFKSKNEWKRHIRSFHIQDEFWVCTYNHVQGKKHCGGVFNRADLAAQHFRRFLAEQYNMKTADEAIKKMAERHKNDALRRRKVGEGFIEMPKELSCPEPGCTHHFSGPKAWDSRLEHTAKHFENSDSRVLYGNLDTDRVFFNWALSIHSVQQTPRGLTCVPPRPTTHQLRNAKNRSRNDIQGAAGEAHMADFSSSAQAEHGIPLPAYGMDSETAFQTTYAPWSQK